jgi:hypothetical protein
VYKRDKNTSDEQAQGCKQSFASQIAYLYAIFGVVVTTDTKFFTSRTKQKISIKLVCSFNTILIALLMILYLEPFPKLAAFSYD